MRNFKKGISLMLASIMILGSFTPILATVNETQTTNTSKTLATDVYFTQDSSFEVTIPKLITLDSTKTSTYEVTVTGDIASNEEIKVVPEETFKMKDQSNVNQKADVDASVTQDKISWLFNEFETKGKGTITAIDLTAGRWKGFFNFNISLENDSVKVVSILDGTGTNLNGTAKPITGYEKEKLLSELKSSDLVEDITNIKSIINVNTDDFTDTATATFDVSKIAASGDQIAIYHYDEETTTWEFIETATVDENGKITVTMTSFSPVAFEITSLTPGLYDADGVMLCSWEESGIDIEMDYNIGYMYANNVYTTPTSGYYVVTQKYPTTTQVIIPKGILKIGNACFYSCRSLTNISIPEGIESIGTKTFTGCESIIKWNLPSTITTIGENAFTNCTGEAMINCAIPDRTFNVEYAPFYNCKFTKVTLNNNIGAYAFNANTTITDIVLTNNVLSIGASSFRNCTGLAEIAIPNSVELIDSSAFQGCSNIANIMFNDNSKLKTIENSAFANCSSLTQIIIPNTVQTIGGNAFSGCTSLELTIVPNSVQTLGAAFNGCTGELIINCDIPDGTSSNDMPLSRCNFTKITINGSIGNYAFYNCDNLTQVIILDRATRIGGYAFYSCDGLVNIIIPANITSIGSYAFTGYSSSGTIIFEDRTSWYAGSTELNSSDLENPIIAAKYLGSTYYKYNWIKQ